MATITYPPEVLRNLPGAGSLPTVEIELPEPGDIREIVVDVLEQEGLTTERLLDGLAARDRRWGAVLEEGLSEALFNRPRGNLEPSPLLADIASEIAKEVDIEGVTSDDIIESVLEALEVDGGDIVLSIEGSLFAVDSDFEDLIERAIEDADIAVEGGEETRQEILERLSELADAVDSVSEDIADLQDELADEVADVVTETIEEELGDGLSGDVDVVVDRLTESLAEQLVSQEASEDLQSTLDNL